jgi:HEAT repeat protein
LTETPTPIPDLIAQLSDPDQAVRQAAAIALGDAKAVEAIEPLKQVVQNDPVKRIRHVALGSVSDMDDPRVIPFLIDLFRDAEMSWNAAQYAGDLAPLSIQPLMDVLMDEQQEIAVRAGTLNGLAACASSRWAHLESEKTPDVVEPIIDLLIAHFSHEITDLRVTAAASFRYVRVRSTSQPRTTVRVSRATQPLLTLLADPSPAVRRAAVDSLGCIRDEAAIDTLIACLKDPDSDVRAKTADMLSYFKSPRTVPFLIECLTDEVAKVRAEAALSLGLLNDMRAVEPLLAYLTDINLDVLKYAIKSLGELRDQRALEPIRKILELEQLEAEPDEDIIFGCYWALAELGDNSALQPLIDHLPDRGTRARRAARGLGDLGNPAAFEPLLDAWKSSEWHYGTVMSRHIITALKKLNLPKAMAVFTALSLDDSDPNRQRCAKLALQRLQGIDPDLSV